AVARCVNQPEGARDAFAYIPFPSRQLKGTLSALAGEGLVTVRTATRVPKDDLRLYRHLRPPAADPEPPGFVGQLWRAIVSGLVRQGVSLDPDDHETLKFELAEQQWHMRQARAELELFRPRVVIMHADNHSPFIEYALLARQRRV